MGMSCWIREQNGPDSTPPQTNGQSGLNLLWLVAVTSVPAGRFTAVALSETGKLATPDVPLPPLKDPHEIQVLHSIATADHGASGSAGPLLSLGYPAGTGSARTAN